MTDNPNNPTPQREEPQESEEARRPRGLGGVILIMLLLLALFVMVSKAGSGNGWTIYDFNRLLVEGRLSKVTWEENDTWHENRVIAEVEEPGKKGAQKIEVALGEFSEIEAQRILCRELAPRKLEPFGRGGLARFLEETKNHKIAVKRAIFANVVLPKTKEGAKKEEDPRRKYTGPLNYMTAIIQDGNEDRYVQVLPDRESDSGVTLATVRQYMGAEGTPIHDMALALDPEAFEIKEVNTTLLYLVGTIGPYILVIAIIWFFIMRQMRAPGGSGGVLSFGRSKAAVYTRENRTNITFDDVAGADEAKEEVREIIEFLKHPGKFAKLGGSIPRGVLLVGPPGTGKTLMAKAIAGEAEVPFFSISGSDFVEMFVGVGASRVRDLFKQARESSPCLIFLDEIDAVGRRRGSGMGGGHDEREQTLNAILVEMDGFDSDKGIILIAATNRPDVLDPALLRPGRFDRQIVIDMPHLEGREAILKVHGRKVKLSPRVELGVIARATPGFSGADLAAIINEAAILAAMKGQDAIEMADLEEARDRVRWGREKRSRAMEEEDRRVTAYHEAGHALVSIKIPVLDPVHKVTIVSRGMALGATMSLPERDDYHTRKNKLLGLIAMCYGGRIAEAMVFGDISAGAQNDIEKATEIAKMMVCQLGMSEVIGPINYGAKNEVSYLGREMALAYDVSQDTMEKIHAEVRRIIHEQYQRAETIIHENRKVLEAIAEGLLRHETLTGQEVLAIARGDDLEEFRASQERAQKAKEAKDEARRKASTAAEERDEPEVGLSGAEGLAHS